eukprot:5151796-Amphidinium_carterae.1
MSECVAQQKQTPRGSEIAKEKQNSSRTAEVHVLILHAFLFVQVPCELPRASLCQALAHGVQLLACAYQSWMRPVSKSTSYSHTIAQQALSALKKRSAISATRGQIASSYKA